MEEARELRKEGYKQLRVHSIKANLVSSDESCAIVVPPQDTHSGTVDGALLKEGVFCIVVGGYLSTPPANSNELLLRVPLHTLHHGRAVDRSFLYQLTLCKERLIDNSSYMYAHQNAPCQTVAYNVCDIM